MVHVTDTNADMNADMNDNMKITAGESILLTFEASRNDSRLRSLA